MYANELYRMQTNYIVRKQVLSDANNFIVFKQKISYLNRLYRIQTTIVYAKK